MSAKILKLDRERWESVADLARRLLTHADEYECAIVIVRERRRKAGDEQGDLKTFACPVMPIIEAVGALEMAKSVYIDQAKEQTECLDPSIDA